MNVRRDLFPLQKVLLGGMLLVALAGCVGRGDGPRAGVYVQSPGAGLVLQDDFVYYPNYQIYYSNNRQQYAYKDGANWVYRPSPHGVSLGQLKASPSVRMEFHDSPAYHHAAVVKQYPKNWTPPRPGAGQNRGNNHDDEHGDHPGK